MEAVETQTATKEQKGQTFIKSVAVHLCHAIGMSILMYAILG